MCFLFTTASKLALGPSQSFIHWVEENLFPGVRWSEREDFLTFIHYCD